MNQDLEALTGDTEKGGEEGGRKKTPIDILLSAKWYFCRAEK